MMHTIAPAHLEAFTQMLARPDPADLPRRAYVCRYDGDPDRRTTRYPQILMSWLQRRYLEIDCEEPLRPATRQRKTYGRTVASPLRLLRPTGTC